LLALVLALSAAAAPGPLPPLDAEAEIEGFLKKDVCGALKADARLLAPLLDEGFSATPVQEPGIVPLPSGEWHQEEVHFAGPPATDRGRWAEDLERYLAPLAIRTRCSVGAHALKLGRPARTAEAGFNLLLAGSSPDGSRIQDSGEIRVALVKAGKPGAWRIQKVELDSRTRVRARSARFADVTEAAGLPRDFKEDGIVLRLESVAVSDALDRGGLAVADVNGDGYPDIFVSADGPSLLFLSKGDGTFEEAAARVGLADEGNARGAVFADLDGDGDLDLVVAHKANAKKRGDVVVYRNDGGHFTRAFQFDSAPRVEFMHIAVADVNGDGRLDLHVAAYGTKDAIPDDLLDSSNGASDLLLINEGNLQFVNRAKGWGVADKGWTLASTLVDLDGDGFPDLICADDFGHKRLYRNDGGKRFVDVTASSGLGDERANGMGIAVADVNGDGQLDIYFSNMHSNAGLRLVNGADALTPKVRERLRRAASGNTLWLGRGGLKFDESGVALGVADGGWAYGVLAFDADDDGAVDLFSPCGYFTGQEVDDY
jgi:hypothetical protein